MCGTPPRPTHPQKLASCVPRMVNKQGTVETVIPSSHTCEPLWFPPWIITIIQYNPIYFHQMIIAKLGSFLWFVVFVWASCPCLISRVLFPLILTDRALCCRALPRHSPWRFSVMSLWLRRWTLLCVFPLEGSLLEVDARWPRVECIFSSAPAF